MVKIALLTTFSASVASCAVRVCQCLNTRIDALLAPIWLDREARKYVTCRCAELAGGQHVTAPLRHVVFRGDGPHLDASASSTERRDGEQPQVPDEAPTPVEQARAGPRRPFQVPHCVVSSSRNGALPIALLTVT